MPTLNWIGKDAVINHHIEVPFRLLKDVPELGCGDPGSGNLIVEGDNLVALKALLPCDAARRFSRARLEREGITFKQTPYAIRVGSMKPQPLQPEGLREISRWRKPPDPNPPTDAPRTGRGNLPPPRWGGNVRGDVNRWLAPPANFHHASGVKCAAGSTIKQTPYAIRVK